MTKQRTFTIAPPKGSTRLCLDPWAKALIKADGQVCLCCNAPPVGSLADSTLPEILDNQNTRLYRLGLLTGDPMPACRFCPDRQTVPVETLQQRVRDYLQNGVMDVY